MKLSSYSLSFLISMCTLSSHAADATWIGGTGNWSTGANWDNNIGPANGDRIFFDDGDIVSFNLNTTDNFRAIEQSGGTINILGEVLKATELASATTFFNGTVNQFGGLGEFNRVMLGSTNGASAEYFLNDGDLVIARALNGFSIYLGGLSNTGTGSLSISSGSLTTRAGIILGSATDAGLGHFKIEGSAASEIGLGEAGDGFDGLWEQHADSTLTVLIDNGGVTPILLKDNDNDDAPNAIFEDGAVLDVGYINGGNPGVGGTWTVMEVENGDIIDNGLTLAAGTDTSIWSFSVDNSGANGVLTVTAQETAGFTADVIWDGSESSAWENSLNWNNDFGPFDGANAMIFSGTADFTESSERGYDLRAVLMSGGVLNITGGELSASRRASAHSDLDGVINHSGGNFNVNAVEIGSVPASNGSYNLSGGDLRIARTVANVSLFLGGNASDTDAGNGSLIISDGSLSTRSGVVLGSESASGIGHFSVLGAEASEINIGGAGDDSDAFWIQNSGSTLEVGISSSGVTPITIIDSASDTTGTIVSFAKDSLLDVGYHNITEGGGSWVVMEVENGNIINNGLTFAPGVDTSIWSYEIDNSGTNGRLIVTAVGESLGYDIVIGNTQQQKMRYGMDYERLWFWTGGLNGSERDDIARWSAVDTNIDFVRVAINSGYELTEGEYNLSAYTNRIFPMMSEMQQANPDIKFFASPRPLEEAESGAAWQPYPRWITRTSSLGATDYNLDNDKCAKYLERYLQLMKDNGYKISFLDLTNEWDTAGRGSGAMSSSDFRDIVGYLRENVDPEDMPLTIGSSAFSYAQGRTWINFFTTEGRRDAIDIAAAHNTGRAGNAADFVSMVKNRLGDDKEIWNTEVHGWKSTSGENETTSFYYYLEAVRAGFSGLNGWLAIGTTGQGHSYILNPSGTPVRNVKYNIFRKFSSTSNYGYALDILEEPDIFVDTDNDYDSGNPRNVAAFIKGNLMTVWVVNEHPESFPVNITPSGYNIATSNVRRTHWIDPSDVEGFETTLPVFGNKTVSTTIPGHSVSCFEITLDTEDFAYERIEGEDFSHQWGTSNQGTGDVDGEENVANISDGDWVRFGDVALEANSSVEFRVARANGRPDGSIRIREGHSEGPIIGEVEVPTTGNWQVYETITTKLDNDAGIYNLYLEFVEDGSTNAAFVNLNWFSVNNESEVTPIVDLDATATGPTSIDLSWSAVTDSTSYLLSRSTTAGGPYQDIASVTGTSYEDTDLTSGVTYYYIVRAINDGDESEFSNEASITLSEAEITDNNLVIKSFDITVNDDGNKVVTLVMNETGIGQTYQMMTSKTLTPNSWEEIGNPQQGNGGSLTFSIILDDDDEIDREFFHVEITSP